MKPTPLPPQDELNDLFTYCHGTLIRKKTASNNAKAGTFAGSDHGRGGYLQVRIQGKLYLVHRLIWKMMHGREPGKCLDHIDGDKSNNRIENLQETDYSHNVRRGRNIGNIQKSRNGKRFRSKVFVYGDQRYIGTFDTREEAQQAIYDFCDAEGIRYD